MEKSAKSAGCRHVDGKSSQAAVILKVSSADQKGCTQILAEPTPARTPEPRTMPARHPRSSLLICVHLRFHFLFA
jgi:hypothetical protein